MPRERARARLSVLTSTELEARLAQACSAGTGPAVAHIRFSAGSSAEDWYAVLDEQLRTPAFAAPCGLRDLQLVVSAQGSHELGELAARIQAAFAARAVALSVGVAQHPADGETAAVLLWTAAGRAQRGAVAGGDDIVCEDPATREAFALAERVARSDLNLIIVGETGTGKDVLARFIHRASFRAAREMLAMNCAALSESLLDSELFGHERGAFTGAVQAKQGLLESVPGGTVFLDEIGELPLATQAKLLRVIEAREILRVGSVKPRPIDVRIIAATNRDLEAEINRGAFRRDLFFRLDGMTITMPPLRDRRLDIVPLAQMFLTAACRRAGRTPMPRLSADATRALEQHAWQGNVRELRNVMERALVLCRTHEVLVRHLALDGARGSLPCPTARPADEAVLASGRLTDSWRPGEQDDAERARIISALNACGGNQTRAAQMLGIGRRTLLRRLERYDIGRPRSDR